MVIQKKEGATIRQYNEKANIIGRVENGPKTARLDNRAKSLSPS